MSTPKLTGYGWLMKLANGRNIEYATDAEALEANQTDDDKEEESNEVH
jgi:hypothetical protein